MDVIRHDDISSHEPVIGVNPNVPQKVVDVRSSQDRSLFVGADGQEDDRGPVGRFPRGQMHRCFALQTFIHSHRRDALRRVRVVCRVRVIVLIALHPFCHIPFCFGHDEAWPSD